MLSQVAISHFKSVMLYITSGTYPLLMQFFLINLLVLAYAYYYRRTRTHIKYKQRRNPLPLITFGANAVVIMGGVTPVFKAIHEMIV